MRLSILAIVQRFQLLFASCNRQSKIYNLRFFYGVLAQLVERLNGIEEVRGSTPLGSRPLKFSSCCVEVLAKGDVIQLATSSRRLRLGRPVGYICFRLLVWNVKRSTLLDYFA